MREPAFEEYEKRHANANGWEDEIRLFQGVFLLQQHNGQNSQALKVIFKNFAPFLITIVLGVIVRCGRWNRPNVVFVYIALLFLLDIKKLNLLRIVSNQLKLFRSVSVISWNVEILALIQLSSQERDSHRKEGPNFVLPCSSHTLFTIGA